MNKIPRRLLSTLGSAVVSAVLPHSRQPGAQLEVPGLPCIWRVREAGAATGARPALLHKSWGADLTTAVCFWSGPSRNPAECKLPRFGARRRVRPRSTARFPPHQPWPRPASHLLLRERLERTPRSVSEHHLHHLQLQQTPVDRPLAGRPQGLGPGHATPVDAVRHRGQDAQGSPRAHAEDTVDHGGSPRAALRDEDEQGGVGLHKLSDRAGLSGRPQVPRNPRGCTSSLQPSCGDRGDSRPWGGGTPSGSVGGEAEEGAAKTPREF